MKTIKIHHKITRSIVFEGVFDTQAHALETAIRRGINLATTDLRHFILAHANLDGADFSGALLDQCDLTGANLSETNLTGTSLRSADLSLAVLSQSRLVDTDFSDSSFHGTLINDATIDACRFTCPSALLLDLASAQLGTNHFGDHSFTTAPVVVSGLPKRIVFLDKTVLIGGDAYDRADFPNPFENLFTDLAPQQAVAD